MRVFSARRIQKALNNWLASRQKVAADAKVDGTMRSREWVRYQHGIDELLASYAFATAAGGLVLLAAHNEPGAAAAGGLYLLVRGLEAIHRSHVSELETRADSTRAFLDLP